MIDLQITMDGEKVIIEGLQKLAQAIPGAIREALNEIAPKIHRIAYEYLSGAGAKGKTQGTAYRDASGKWKIKGQRWTKQSVPAGGYPVPVRSGWLRQMLDWLRPGETKTLDGRSVTAGTNEVIIFDAALYANVIHQGTGSSAKFGPRPFITNALQMFNEGGRIRQIVLDKIEKMKG